MARLGASRGALWRRLSQDTAPVHLPSPCRGAPDTREAEPGLPGKEVLAGYKGDLGVWQVEGHEGETN